MLTNNRNVHSHILSWLVSYSVVGWFSFSSLRPRVEPTDAFSPLRRTSSGTTCGSTFTSWFDVVWERGEVSFVGLERVLVRPPLCTVSHPAVSSLSKAVGSAVRNAIKIQAHFMNSVLKIQKSLVNVSVYNNRKHWLKTNITDIK